MNSAEISQRERKKAKAKAKQQQQQPSQSQSHVLLRPPALTSRASQFLPDSPEAEAERLLGYTFLNPKLLQEALTHGSFCDDSIASYERLEFVGDAALHLAMTNYLFLNNSGLGPGPLSALRSANTNTEKLARVAVRHGLYALLRRNSAHLDKSVQEFTKVVLQEPEYQIRRRSTVKPPKVLADIVEAIAGAVYEDSNLNLELMWTAVKGMLEPIITANALNKEIEKAKNKPSGKQNEKENLRDICFKRNWSQPIYKVQKDKGSTCAKRYLCSVQVDTSSNLSDQVCTSSYPVIIFGEFRSSVSDAEQCAAFKLISIINGGSDR